MNVFSSEFLSNLEDAILTKIGKLLSRIEKQYAIRSRYVSKKHACIYADIDPKTLDKWFAKGLPVSKIDGCFRVDILQIDEFIEKHRI